jgi:hypothetical protein
VQGRTGKKKHLAFVQSFVPPLSSDLRERVAKKNLFSYLTLPLVFEITSVALRFSPCYGPPSMTQPEFSLARLEGLLSEAAPALTDLRTVYARLPTGSCRRRARCCAFLPEMTFLETLSILDRLRSGSPLWRKSLIKKIVRYFFTNPVEISGCPFLESRDCSLYAERAFGCRAYGLWSPAYYQDLVDRNSRAKAAFGQEWHKLGVELPLEVLQYRPPYCRDLVPAALPVSDELLIREAEEVETLAVTLNPWQRFLEEDCFSDLSFFMARWIYGPAEAVRLKFLIVRDWVQKKNQERLADVLRNFEDPFDERNRPPAGFTRGGPGEASPKPKETQT